MLQRRHYFGKPRKGFPSYWRSNPKESEMQLSCLPGDLLSIVMYVLLETLHFPFYKMFSLDRFLSEILYHYRSC